MCYTKIACRATNYMCDARAPMHGTLQISQATQDSHVVCKGDFVCCGTLRTVMGRSLAANSRTKQTRALQSAEHKCDTSPTSLRCSSISCFAHKLSHTCRRQYAACNMLCNMQLVMCYPACTIGNMTFVSAAGKLVTCSHHTA